MKLFLDDVRSPTDCVKYMHSRIGERNLVYLEGNWVIVRSFEEFADYLKTYPLPEVISFDHDLADDHYIIDTSKEAWEEYHRISNREKTGLDCLNYLTEYSDFFQLPLPEVLIHTMNPVGRDNMNAALKSYKKFWDSTHG